MTARWSSADLHIHTTRSDGMHSPARVAAELDRSDLAVAAITDHDTVAGAIEVEEALAGEGPEIVIGTEVSTADGHVIALFVDRDITPGLAAGDTISAIHRCGGLAVAAHPYSISLGVGDLAYRLDFDAVEIINGSPFMEVANGRAARRLGGSTSAALGCSDAHVAAAIGGVRTEFCGVSAADLRASILASLTRPRLSRRKRLAALPWHTAWLAWLPVRRRRGSRGTLLQA